ncbi:PLD nuclease N-terminal domain-containing protein [Nocardioides sp.]|uniref:PLD nuclease N-terminal domain-containing protein n=1 Tax=Nocardioides sp. TaxID=35761 RepID=UPI0025FFDEE2|nr:PLD nuclease N-terminal domain-containing protein [Nocardioides sp.]
MIKVELLLGVATFALWVFCLVDAIGAPADRIRNLPKVGWILLILFFPFVGSIAWLVAGRPEDRVSRRSPYERETPHFPEYDRPGRAAATDPERDDEFLRQVRERAESQRKAYEAQRKRQAEGEAGEQ